MICDVLLKDVTVPLSEVPDLVKFHLFNLLAAILVEPKANYSLNHYLDCELWGLYKDG